MALVKRGAPKSVIDNVNVNVSEPNVDYSFCGLACVGDALDDDPRLTPRQQKQKNDEKRPLSKSRAFFLNNNSINELTGLRATMEALFVNADNVAWLNLSFNEISTLDPLLEMPHLEILYLHGNSISNVDEITKLRPLTELKKATFHGNPVEDVKGYRQNVLANLVSLKVLDFSDVTKEDRNRIYAWNMEKKKMKMKTKEG